MLYFARSSGAEKTTNRLSGEKPGVLSPTSAFWISRSISPVAALSRNGSPLMFCSVMFRW